MIILGIFAEGPNPAACLLVDGNIVAFSEEERFVREKAAVGRYPVEATRFCLQYSGLNVSDVDRIAFGWDAMKYAPIGSQPSFMQSFYDSLNSQFTKDSITTQSESRILERFHP